MSLWIFASLLTLAMIWLVLQPLLRQRQAVGIQPTDVYKAQLNELDREEASGFVSADDAANARTEISRRLLRASEREETATSQGTSPAHFLPIAIGISTFVLALSLGGYIWLGSPGLPGQPFAGRDLAMESAERLGPAAQELERRLAEIADPADRALFLASALASVGAFEEAIEAYLNVLSLREGDADALTGIGEIQLAHAQGVVSAEIASWFDRALESQPLSPRANYYRALYDYQQGRFDDVIVRLDTLLGSAEEDAIWVAQVSGLRDEAEAQQSGLSDTARDVLSLDDEARSARIREMVAGLAARLEQSPDDFDGWLQLANAYGVLGEQEAAETALSRAFEQAGGEPLLEARVNEMANTLGLSLPLASSD